MEKSNTEYQSIFWEKRNGTKAHWNLTPNQLETHTLDLNQGVLSDTGALVVNTGQFTGRSPKDRFIVKDLMTKDTVDWGEVNIPFEPLKFDSLYDQVSDYLKDKEIYVRDCMAGASEKYRLNIRVITEYPWQNMFAYNMFLRPNVEQLKNFAPDWQVIAAPGFKANPETDGTRKSNFAIINFTKKIVLIGGTAYTGEIKKGIFSVLNYSLPHERDVLSMHCSANIGDNGDTALFFGLSGTGKTTLSCDPHRGLIGDDEHGWDEKSIFNFEGGCYAKTIDLSAEKEPQIYAAIKKGAILENVGFLPNSNKVDYTDSCTTENTRVSYPIHFIENAIEPSVGNVPNNIFFLTYDAFGVLPPISKLNANQAMYHFISGYTSKVAGTEEGIDEPKTTFSACFGAPFLPLHPTKYAKLLGERIEKHKVKVWMINTGMTGGVYGTGSRMRLSHTRALIWEALAGNLNEVEYREHPVFRVQIPVKCAGVPHEILNPRDTWDDKDLYDTKAHQLATAFNRNFEKFDNMASEDFLSAAPKIPMKA